MVNVSSEKLLSLADAAKTLPARRGGKRPHVSCIYRWTTTGCRGVVLESVQIGATRCTSMEALERFFAALTAAVGRPELERAGGCETPLPQVRSKNRRPEIKAAEDRLARSGL